MEKDKLSREELVAEYQADIARLVKYIPWLQSKAGQEVVTMYSGDGIYESVMKVPTYDSGLLTFIKEIKTTKFMDRNYVYIYSRHGIRNVQDELAFIKRAKLANIKEVGGILAGYAIRGATKGSVWSDGVTNRVYLTALVKMKEIIELEGGPLV